MPKCSCSPRAARSATARPPRSPPRPASACAGSTRRGTGGVASCTSRSAWRDDLELAAAELALAGQALGDPRQDDWLHAAADWARTYLAREAGRDTLNLYDTSAVAHADLVRAIRAAGRPAGLAVSEAKL